MSEGRRAPWVQTRSAGQASVEFALVMLAFLAVALALAALWHWAAGGGLTQLVEGASSHVFSEGGTVDALADILAF